ncbi:MAG: hypothetical protein ACI9C4_000990 [Paraglaciecola sp.]|jgi:hypothetical protein
MTCKFTINNRRHTQRGAILIISVTLLLTLMSLVTLHTSRVKSLEYKIILNNQNYIQAMAAAKGGLAHGFTLTRQESNWLGEQKDLTPAGYGRASVTAVFTPIPRNTLMLKLVTITSTGFSNDGLAEVTLSEQGLRVPIVAVVPPAPFISAKGLTDDIAVQLAANPNGGGVGVPISLWTANQNDLSVSDAHTCTLQAFDEQGCHLQSHTRSEQAGVDIVDDGVDFPSDLLKYLFNTVSEEWASLKGTVDLNVNSCAEVPWQQSRSIWVSGDCSLSYGQTLGSTNEPVVLIVESGNLLMASTSMIYGLVLMFRPTDTLHAYGVRMEDSAYINGALITNNSLDDALSSIRVRYDFGALNRLIRDEKLQRLARVPGSWRDF